MNMLLKLVYAVLHFLPNLLMGSKSYSVLSLGSLFRIVLCNAVPMVVFTKALHFLCNLLMGPISWSVLLLGSLLALCSVML
jgi:hypothetical protein